MPSNPSVTAELLGKWQIAIQFSFSLSGSDANQYLPTALAMLTYSVSPGDTDMPFQRQVQNWAKRKAGGLFKSGNLKLSLMSN